MSLKMPRANFAQLWSSIMRCSVGHAKSSTESTEQEDEEVDEDQSADGDETPDNNE